MTNHEAHYSQKGKCGQSQGSNTILCRQNIKELEAKIKEEHM